MAANNNDHRVRIGGWWSVLRGKQSNRTPKKVITTEEYKRICKGSDLERDFELFLLSEGLDYFKRDYRGLPGKRYRIDFADVDRKIAIELEGGVFGEKKSRHTTGTGYQGDTRKYNLLIISGWKLLRYVNMDQVEEEFLRDYELLKKSCY